eukprot:7389677-Prymnesium_polylepis.3
MPTPHQQASGPHPPFDTLSQLDHRRPPRQALSQGFLTDRGALHTVRIDLPLLALDGCAPHA